MHEQPNITFRRTLLDDMNWVNTMYQKIGFLPSIQDEIIMLAIENGIPVGLGRMVLLGRSLSVYEL